jgi:hypothetical protein
LRRADSEMRATTKADETDQGLDSRAERGDLGQGRGERPGDAGEGDQVQGVTGKSDAEAEDDHRQQRVRFIGLRAAR